MPAKSYCKKFASCRYIKQGANSRGGASAQYIRFCLVAHKDSQVFFVYLKSIRPLPEEKSAQWPTWGKKEDFL